MQFIIEKSSVSGKLSVPGSKSHSIRALAVACMAEGISKINLPLLSEDAMSAMRAAEALGARIERLDNDRLWLVEGTGGRFKDPWGTIDLANSGTSLRIFSALAALGNETYSFDGDLSLRTRLMGSLLDALKNLGAECDSQNGKCPLSVKGPLRGGKTTVDGTTSQFLSALLFAGPAADGDSEITLEFLNEKPYVQMTLDWLKRQDICIEYSEDLLHFKIPGGQHYQCFERTIPADFSTAAFPLAAAALTAGRIEIDNLDFSDTQGDKLVFDFFEQMGVKINKEPRSTIIDGPQQLEAFELDLNATPDALPVIAVAATRANGVCRIFNVAQARVKETDRIDCMTRELRKMGAKIKELPDGMVIEPTILNGAELESHGDHRIAMALSVAAMTANGPSIINGADAAMVTYPDFLSDMQSLGAKMTGQ